MTTVETTVAILGLALLTVLTRAFFLLPERELPLPEWLQQGPALCAAGRAGCGRRTRDRADQRRADLDLEGPAPAGGAGRQRVLLLAPRILGTILSGTAVLLILRLGFGW
jgi:hypothetical protein